MIVPVRYIYAVFLLTDLLIRAAERHDDGVAIHTDPSFLGFDRFLKLWREGIDAGLEEIAFIEIQNLREHFFQRLRFQIRGNFFCEPENDLRPLRFFRLVVPADRHGLGTRTDADLNAVRKAFLVLAAPVELDLNFVVAEIDIGYRNDLPGLNGLAVLFHFLVQLFFINLAGFGQLDPVGPERHRDAS